MKINFVIPFIGKTGGIAVVLRHARGLRELGHDVAVYYPLAPYREFLFHQPPGARKFLMGTVKPALGNLLRYRRSVSWTRPAEPVRPVPWIGGAFIRDADAVIASAWPTAHSVAALPRGKGAKFYFIQHYETWSSDIRQVDASYRLPLAHLTIAPWLTELMESRFAGKVRAEIHNGIDADFFRPPAPGGPRRPSILMMYHPLEWKGGKEGLAALERIHARHPGVPIRLFGMDAFPQAPAFAEYHRDPSPEALRALYQGSAVFLSPSHLEGWGLPVAEAMASGCAVVATRTGGAPVLAEGGALLLVEPKDVTAMEQALDSLIREPALAQSLSEKGLAAAARHTWPRATKKLEAALLGPAPGGTGKGGPP